MLPTIKQIREANGGLDNLTDFEIAQHQHQQYKAYVPDFNRFAEMVGVDPGTKWGNRWSASIDSAQASLAGVGESALDIEGLRDVRIKNSLDARNSRQFARSQGAVMESGQVDGVGSALEYVGGLAVDTTPQMAATLGAGALGTLAAGPVGGAAAAGSVGYSFAMGDILENQRDQTGGRTDVGSAALLAVPYALADTFTGAGGTLLKLSKGTLPKAGLNLLDKTLDGVQGIKGAALRTGVNVGKVSLAEGAGETFQEGMNQLGRMAVDPNETFLNDRSAEAFKESFIGGAALGGAIGGVTGGWRRSDSYQPPIDANGGVNLLNGQPLNPLVPQPAGPQLGYDPMAGDSRLITFPDGTTAFPEDVPERRAQLAAQDHPGFVERAAEYPEVPLVSLEQAALAEDKAKIEAAQAVQAEAKDLGIKGKGISLYQQLKQAWDDGVITEADFREQRVQLGAKGNTDVARFLKGAYAASEARSVTQAAAAQEQAGLVESLKVQAAAQPEGVDPLEQDIQAAMAAQQGDVTDVQAREVQPVADAQTPARRNWSDAPGAVAGIAPDKTVEVGRSGRKKALTPAQVLEKIKKASPLNKMRILAATGMDMVADPTTGAPKLVISGNPMTLDEIVDAESEATGKKVSKQAISQALADAGIDADVATQVASTDSGTVYTEADLGITPTDEGVADASGFRIEDTASKATNQGVIYDEVTGNADLTKVANALLKGTMTPEAAAQAVEGKTSKTTAAQDTKRENAVTTAVEMPTTDTTKSDTVVTDLRDLTDATIEQNIRDLLDGHPERDNAASDWGSTKLPWDTLPDTFRADWIEQYGEIVDQFDGDLNQAAFRLLDAIQANIEDSYSDYIKYKGQQAASGTSPEALPGGEGRKPVVARAEEARPAIRDESPAQAGRVEGPAAEPVENTSAEDQRVAQENAAKAKVVVKKKRTIQKPVEADTVAAQEPTSISDADLQGLATAQGAAPAASESTLERWFKSEAFKRWFGASKVVDSDGQPMVMYHGTSADITEFTPRQAGAIFVTSNPQFAAAFSGLSAARARASKRDGAENIIPVFVRAESPFDLDNKKQVAALRQHLSSDSVLDDKELKKHGVRDVETVIQFLMHGDRGDTRIWAVIEAPSVQAAIKEAGHDGFYVYENGEKNLGVYASTQLKSATGNNGQFDPNNPKILENLERLTSNTQPLVGESTRVPSVSRQVRTLLSKLDSGEISAEAFANRLEMAVNAADRAKDNKPVTDRVRGADYFRQKLLEAKRRGDLSEEAVDLAEWFIQGNPALLDDVGISVRSSKNDGVSGFYDTMRRVVSLVKESGNAETTVHELLHHFERMMPAPVQDAIRKSWLNSLAKGIATAKKSGNADLVAYYQHLSDLHLGGGGQSSLLAAQQLIRDGKVPYEHYANINASEFWAVNGSAIVAGRFKASQSVLGRLRNWLSELGQKIKAAFGLQSDAPIIRALDSLAKSDGKFVSGSMLAKADSYNNVTQSVAQQLGPQYAKAETALTRAIGDLKTAAIKYGAFTRDLIDQAAKLMPAARKYLEHYEAVATDRTRMEQQVDAVLERFAALNTHERARVNEVVRTSTMSKEWAFKPDWLPNAKYDENSDVARAFRALTPAQRGVIQDVFRHGHDTLEAMQKAVKDNVNSEFDVLIKGFRDAGNMDEAAKAEARKAKALTEFSSMLEMNGNWPYAPLRRFGDHVVVAKSAAYRAAELADDKAQIKALEADENHYYVEFFESRGDARKAVDNMQATGKYDQVENFNKGNANEQLYGGRDVFNAFRRLRGLVNETGGASLSEPADATINKLMNDLYLSLLGERSARQAERNRKNTAGADRDMMRAFATKGRADAHFIASLRFGGQVQEDLLKMKKEADEGPNGGTRELRREYFNEILARHTMQMDFQSTPVVDKVMATSSLWQLLFNPAYYLQNVMQPWVMSLPMLAGKHGYGKSWSALARAYRDLGPLIKDGAFSKGDYDALPADVQSIVKDLAARGRIEITLEHDLGQWNSNVDDGRVTRTWTKVTKGLGKVNSRLEMLNRLATGIAAARLEGVGNAKNATDYADRVIIGTHGDYNAFNAPRLMRTPLGRMATQFRKFQLIQITMYTKLVSDALKGASPTERAVARRVLAYNLGHMAALGGAMGLPGFQLFSMVLGSIFGDDDEPDDAEATLRRTLGNGPLTDALTRGVPNMLGVDLSGKVGSGNMLSLFPYADWDIESRSGYQNLLAAAAGPFVGGLMPKWADAVGTAKQGDYYKALEKVLPGAIGNAIKGTRFAVDGVTTTRGVQAMSADEITWVDGLFQAVGLPTSTITDRNFRSSAEYKASKFFDEKSSQVKKDYVEAFQDNDTDAMAEARQEWLDMQATRKRLGLTVQPLSQLIKAPRERMKRDRMAVGGVAADKETQGFVKNLME